MTELRDYAQFRAAVNTPHSPCHLIIAYTLTASQRCMARALTLLYRS